MCVEEEPAGSRISAEPAGEAPGFDTSDAHSAARQRYNSMARETQRHRSHAEVARFFSGLELLPPGLVPVQQWRPQSDFETQAKSAMWGGVARKP